MPFSPHYIRLVLQENFADAQRLLLDPLLAIHDAHLVMLVEQGIVPRTEARTIREALAQLDVAAIRQAAFDGRHEDLFFHVDHLLIEACGADTAGRLHTARSRNDIDMTMYRLRLRECLLDVAGGLLALRRVLLDLATAHVETIYAAHTHTQPAQPTTVAHYLLAVIEQLERDTRRVMAAYVTTNVSPLGACAITGTGFPIDRRRTAHLLGFDDVTGNTYGSIATVDYVLEGASAVATMLTGIGRFVQDLLLWCTVEFGYLRLSDGFVQGSSIMPQKRNPVALEHARALSSRALAQAAAMPITVHNTPFGDIVDTEDDLQPLVAAMYADATRALALVAAAMRDATFDVARMRERASAHGVTVTELADTLARERQLPFAHTHAIAARFVQQRLAQPGGRASAQLAEASAAVTGEPVYLGDAELDRLLSPEYFVAIRRTHGGPAPDVVRTAIEDGLRVLATDAQAVDAHRASIAAAVTRRREALDAI